MLVSPCAKLNLGLNVVERRADGYHNLETVFIPVPLYDALEINVMDERFPSETACDIKISVTGWFGRRLERCRIHAKGT